MAMDIWGLDGAWTPITFSVEFIYRMRKERERILAGPPSTRQAIAIPKFLTARFHRRFKLLPEDYIQAAVFTTPIVDQELARQIAMSILFPESDKRPLRTTKAEQGLAGTPADALKNQDPMLDQQDASQQLPPQLKDTDFGSGIDQIMSEMSIFGDSEDGFDIPDDIGAMIDQEIGTMDKLLNFVDSIMTSPDAQSQSFRNLLETRGGTVTLLRYGIDSVEKLRNLLKDAVSHDINSLSPRDVAASVQLGWGDEIASRSSSPWEQLAAQYATKQNDFEKNLQSTMKGDPSTAAKSLQYLKAVDFERTRLEKLVKEIISKMETLWDIDTISQPLGEVPAFDHQSVMKKSLDDLGRAFRTASKIDQQFGTDFRKELFDTFQQQYNQEGRIPSIEDMALSATDAIEWKSTTEQAIDQSASTLSKDKNPESKLKSLAKNLKQYAQNLEQLPGTHASTAKTMEDKASDIGQKALDATSSKEQFLQYLDEMLEAGIKLEEGKALKSGMGKGVNPDEIYERFGGSFEILKGLVETKQGNMFRYSHQMQKIGMSGPMLSISKGFTKPSRSYAGDLKADMKELMQTALSVKNREAMAAMGHADMKMAMEMAKSVGGPQAEEQLVESLSRGPGENLLLQWFMHRHTFPASVKKRVRELAKKALIEVAMNWPTGRLGSGEKGLAPSNKMRPYRDGDDMDQIDIESTVEGIVLSGKSPTMLSTDDLMVWDTERGRVAACFLLDVSGSMSGQKLAICAISVIMLVGNLKPEEVAVAMFESNTHKIKGFEEKVDLDDVADELLDIRAMGGTCALAAMKWGADQLENSADSEHKLLMIFTDAMTEDTKTLKPQLERYANMQARFIVALDGRLSQAKNAKDWAELTDGEVIELKSLHEVPRILSDILNNLQ